MKIDTATQRRLACLGDASRYRLVMALASGPRCVTDLAEAVGLSQSCTTRHLQVLQGVGLVRRIRDGKRVMVRLNRDEPEAGRMIGWVLERVRTVGPKRGSRGTDRASEPGGSNGSRRRVPPEHAARSRTAAPAARAGSGVAEGGQPADTQRPPEPDEPPAAAELVEASEGSRIDGASDGDHGDTGDGEGRPIRRLDTIEDYLL
jgi:DNA-binding transcriptional ArsR family regulator